MNRRRLAIACVALCFAVVRPSTLLAQSPPPDPRTAIPERPSVATHAHTIAVGYVELETGIQRLDPEAGTTEYDTPSLVKFGLASHLQLDVYEGVSTLRQSGQNAFGIGDVSVGIKWRILDGAPVVGDVAAQSNVKFPTGSADKGTGTGTTDLSLLLISSNQLGPVSLDVNVGFTRRSGDASLVPNQAMLWAVSFGLPIGGRLGWVAEVFGLPGTTGPAGKRPVVGLTVGPTIALRRYLVLDCGAIVGIDGLQASTVYAGMTWNIACLWRPHARAAAARQRADVRTSG